jgi:hypothetical protein
MNYKESRTRNGCGRVAFLNHGFCSFYNDTLNTGVCD